MGQLRSPGIIEEQEFALTVGGINQFLVGGEELLSVSVAPFGVPRSRSSW
jgi:hypothetical protein